MGHYKIIRNMPRKELIGHAEELGITRPKLRLSSTLRSEISKRTRQGRIYAPVEEWSGEELMDELRLSKDGRELPLHQRQWEDWKDRGELVQAVKAKLAAGEVRDPVLRMGRNELIKAVRRLRKGNPELPRFPRLRETRELRNIVISYDPSWRMDHAFEAMKRRAWPGIQDRGKE